MNGYSRSPGQGEALPGLWGEEVKNKLVPWEDGCRHLEGNSAAHLKASLMGFSQQIIVERGTWQGIWFCEYDGPRRRSVYVQVMGEAQGCGDSGKGRNVITNRRHSDD